jgi:hypothetical protein
VVRKRQDLGWAWDLLGWVAEQKGNVASAVENYSQSLLASSFSDQSIRFRTHWFPERYGKFAAFRLVGLQSRLSNWPNTAVFRCYLQDQEGLRERVYAHWLALANECSDRNEPNLEYEMLYRAGWDLGINDLSKYNELLHRMVQAANRGGEFARARVAATHLVNLENK